jgi:acetyl esterase
VEELRGLPPHAISVNELDPLRDEGLEHFAKLAAAGVSVYSRTVNGSIHAGDCLSAAWCPEQMSATLRDIKGFSDGLQAK